MYYKSGVYVKSSFSAKEFALRYLSHVVTLVEMHKTNAPHLEEHCAKLAASLQ
jgi:hypothetical protein